MQKIIAKEDLCKKIKELLKDFEIIGPKKLLNKGIFYQPLADVQDLYLDEGFAIEPIKKFFLEPSSCVLKYSHYDRVNVETASQIDTKRIIIGPRPCEIRGLILLDKVFDSDCKDSFYINNRQRAVIIGLACNMPDRTCFCTSVGGSPVEPRGMDVLLFDRNDKFLAEIITEKGKEIFASLGEEPGKEEKKTQEHDNEKIKGFFKKKMKVPENLDKIFAADYWTEVSKPCISCGICTYLCPSCYCFDLVDEVRKRLRCYDGCSFADFTLQASGENPRPTKRERYRQRVFHKFDYFKKNFGENLCVGCGRCIRFCPVKIDISEIVAGAPIS